jgi:hypothetical protein
MSIDDLARTAAAQLRDASARTFDIEASLASIGPASRRRTRVQQAAALVTVTVLILIGWLAVRPAPSATPPPISTPSPSPTASGTSTPRPLVVENAVVRPDPVEHRAYVILTIRNTSATRFTSLAGHAEGPNGSDASALTDQVAYGLYTTAAGSKAMLAAPTDIEGIIQSANDRPNGILDPGAAITGLVRVRPDCSGAAPFPSGQEDVVLTDPIAQTMIYQPLIQVPDATPAWLSVAVSAACSEPAPGSDIVDTLASPVLIDGTGTQTVELGTRPAAATRVEIRLACLSTGVFDYEDGTGLDCTESIIGENTLPREPSTVLTLAPGQHTTRIKATAGARWRLSTTYDRVRRVPWGVNASGQTFGVTNPDGTPDLVQVMAGNGQLGYAKAAQMARPSTPAASPDPVATVTVYASDGQTVLGQFLNH